MKMPLWCEIAMIVKIQDRLEHLNENVYVVFYL